MAQKEASFHEGAAMEAMGSSALFMTLSKRPMARPKMGMRAGRTIMGDSRQNNVRR